MANFTPAGVELTVRGAKGFFGTLNKANSKIAGFGKAMAKAAVGGALALGAAVTGIGAASIKAAVSFESAFAGVIKTTDGLVDEFGNLTEAGAEIQQGFRDLAKEVPTAVEELLAIGELGGQLGIARENLVDFTKTIAAMGEATNLTTEEAATGFAQLANIMGTPQDQIENMGSSIVALGNNFATTERDILNFAQRIAGAGQIAGLTEDQIFAIGAAMSSVGVQAEAGGTAVQKVLLNMNNAVLEGSDQLEIFAATAGESAEDFAKLWEKDAGKAFDKFVKGLGDAGDDALGILDALDLKDQRLTRAFLSLAGAGDLLTDAMELSNTAYQENTALTAEAEARYRTTAAQFDIFKNTIKDLAITIGQTLLPFVNNLLQAAQPLIAELGQRLPGFLNNQLIPAIRQVGSWLGNFLPQAIAWLTDAWNNTLRPALETFWSWYTNNYIPLLEGLFEWLGEKIPVAIQVLSDFWNSTLLPAIQTVATWIQGTLIPALRDFGGWLSVAIPDAMQVLSDIWASVLQPALAGIWAFIQDPLIPIITSLFNWFKEKIPEAFAVLKGFWESTGKGIFQDVKNFIEDPVIPIIKKLIGWLSEKIPIAFETVKSVWEDPLKPTLQAIFDIVGDIIGAIGDVVSWLSENIPKAFGAVKSAWESTGAKAFGAIREMIEGLLGVIKTVVDAIGGLVKAAKDAAEFVGQAFAPGEDVDVALGGGIVPEANILGDVSWQRGGFFPRGGRMLSRFDPGEIVLPLRSGNAINTLASALRRAMVQAQGALPVAGGGNTTITNNTINLNMSNSFGGASDMALFEARTLQAVNQALQQPL